MTSFKNPYVFDSSSRIQWNIRLVLIQGKFPLSSLHIMPAPRKQQKYIWDVQHS